MRQVTSWAAIAAGAVGLAVLDGVVSRPGAADNVGGWLAGAGKAVNWFLSPAVPAFSTASTSATTTAVEASLQGSAGGTATTPPSSSASTAPKQPAAGVTNPSQQTVAQGGNV